MPCFRQSPSSSSIDIQVSPRAPRGAIRTVAERLAGGSAVQETIFVLFSDADLAVYQAAAGHWSSSR